MSRKGPSKKHQLLPDPIYGSTVVAQLINKILLDGKKSIAEDIVYSALDMVKEKTDQEPVAVLKRALDNIRPSLEVRSRRVGGATYQVPVEVKPGRANTLSLRWLTLPNTTINEAVVQTTNNDYYLRRDVKKNYAYEGCYYMDYCRKKNFAVRALRGALKFLAPLL